MPTFRADDSDQFGCGILGTGSPSQFTHTQDGAPELVNSVGVMGLGGTPNGVSNFVADTLGRNMGVPVSAAVAGFFASDTSEQVAFGFVAGHDPTFGTHTGVYGESDQQGVMGLTTVPQGTGVYGGGTTGSNGDQIGVRGETSTRDGVLGHSFGTGNGVHGISSKNGVFGESSSNSDSGVLGVNSGNGFGVFGVTKGGTAVGGQSDTGIGVFGKGGHLAGRFEGDVEVTGDIRLVNADVAEDFSIIATEQPEPGSVMVLNAEGALQQSHSAYDRRVAGVLSGAAGYRPGLILDKRESIEQRFPVALLGKVYCKVDAQYSRIEVGDLLTTSPTPGHAMKAGDPMKAFGAVIGKALSGLTEGRGMIPILVALQ